MAIAIPTVDEFTESTVMLVIREIAEYICGDNGLVAQINNNDITGFTSSYTNNVLKIDATKGDGSTLPVCNVTIEGGSSTGNPYPTAVNGTVGSDGNITFTITMSSGTPLTTTINMNYFASTADLSDLQEQVSGIKPVVTTNLESSPPTITVSVNGTSSTANLPSGGSGGNGWEKLNLTSLPTDFAEGDTILIFSKITVTADVNSWNTAPSLPTIGYDQYIEYPIMIKLHSIYRNYNNPIAINTSAKYVGMVNLTNIADYNSWNNPGQALLTIQAYAFNGDGRGVSGPLNITRANITTYISEMYRLKNM